MDKKDDCDLHFRIEDTAYIRNLNVDKIKDIDDIKRVLNFLNIKAYEDKHTRTKGLELVEDLFD